MISLVVAMDRNGLIGREGGLPWRIKSEMEHFQKMTTGGVCIFGRKTWESIKKPLNHRVNYVISKTTPRFGHEHHANVTDNIYDALSQCHRYFPQKEIFICGGRSLYNEALPFADRIYLSCIWGDYEGDTYFPCKPLDLMYDNGFVITEERGTPELGEVPAWDFYLLERHVREF